MKTNMQVRFPLAHKCNLAATLMLVLLATAVAHAQLTPSGDAYTNTADPTTNYGAKTLLDVESASQTTYIQFNLSSIPSGYTGADITQATLKIYVSAVTKAGSFNVDYVNGTWSEGTIDANSAPALGSTIAASVPLTTADKNQYILINVTAAVQAWLNGSQANDGIALVGNSPLNASFDSKENTTTSHPAELDIVFAGGGGITGITTAGGSGLIGGGASGTLSLSLTNACAANQVLQWNGTAWVCAVLKGSGTITGVTAGTDLTGGGTSGNVTLSLNTAATNALYAQLAANNTFSGAQTINNTTLISGTNSFGELQVTNSTSSGGAAAIYGNASATGTGNTIGVEGFSSATSGYGVYGVAAGAGVYGVGAGAGPGVYGDGLSTGPGVYGDGDEAPGVQGESKTDYGGYFNGGSAGVYGESDTNNDLTPAIYGLEEGSTAQTIGVFGETFSNAGTGVYGQISPERSGTGGLIDAGSGVWGDAGSGLVALGVVGTSDNETGGFFLNNNTGNYALVGYSASTGGYPFSAVNSAGNGCYIDPSGDINCTGSKNAVVPINGGQRKVALSAIESPKNWFEDFGSEQLSKGAAIIALESEFAQTVNPGLEYHVFLTPNGDCKGLYVSQKTPTSFEVRELGGGTSSVSFDYRIVALRKNFENIRLADHTNDPDPLKMMKKGTPTHSDSKRLIPPKREAPLMPIAQSIAPRAKK
jgi:TGF-beta propeptide